MFIAAIEFDIEAGEFFIARHELLIATLENAVECVDAVNATLKTIVLMMNAGKVNDYVH